MNCSNELFIKRESPMIGLIFVFPIIVIEDSDDLNNILLFGDVRV